METNRNIPSVVTCNETHAKEDYHYTFLNNKEVNRVLTDGHEIKCSPNNDLLYCTS